jgi:hypothetical protein
VAGVEHAGYGLLSRGPGGGAGRFWVA